MKGDGNPGQLSMINQILQFNHDQKDRENGEKQYEIVHSPSFDEPTVRHHRIAAMQRLLTLSGVLGLPLLSFIRVPIIYLMLTF